jgi:branched-chain amino acid transport system permease protein
MSGRAVVYFTLMGLALAAVGFGQSWNVALGIMAMCLISAVMALGVNIQWGYAGLFNVGIMGFTALGGLAAVLISMPPVPAAWSAGGVGVLLSGLLLIASVIVIVLARRMVPARWRTATTVLLVLAAFFLIRQVYLPATAAIGRVDPAQTGYLGGFGLPVLLSWLVGGAVAAGAAWLVGKVALGLRADYLAIATLGIAEIIIAIIKYEDWLTRGVKNVTGLPRPVPREVDLVDAAWFVDLMGWLGVSSLTQAAGVFVKLCYIGLFLVVLGVLLWLSERALKSPWGRMMRAIRDNRDAAAAMGKDVTARHLQVFVLGCAVVGIAGAMLTTLDGQFTPTSYIPLRYTFLIWVMVILGGSGNNWGAVLGGFIIWFVWIQAEPAGHWAMQNLTVLLGEGHWLRTRLIDGAVYMRYILMGLILLLVLRFAPRGLLPERTPGGATDAGAGGKRATAA